MAFASRFLSDTEKKYANNELQFPAVPWGLERFRLFIYGKPMKLLTHHQALELQEIAHSKRTAHA